MTGPSTGSGERTTLKETAWGVKSDQIRTSFQLLRSPISAGHLDGVGLPEGRRWAAAFKHKRAAGLGADVHVITVAI